MFKLLKYELKGRAKLIVWGSIAVVLAHVFLLLNYTFDLLGIFKVPINIGAFAPLVLISIAGIIVIIIDSINILRKDLNKSTGYLMLTLPQRGYSIIGSKIVVAFVEFLLFSILNTVFTIIHLLLLIQLKMSRNTEVTEVLSYIIKAVPEMFIFFMGILVVFLYFLLLIYFSLVSTKSFLSNRKSGTVISFAIFILMLIGFDKLDMLITEKLPYSINFKVPNTVVGFLNSGITLNIASVILTITILAGLFICTSWLMERRVEI